MLKPYLIAMINMVGKNAISVTGWAYWTSPDTITAYSTLALFIVTFLLVVVTALYVREVRNQAKDLKDQAGNLKRQANAMETQSNLIKSQSEAMTRQANTLEAQFDIIRDESVTMKRQADAMDGQSKLIREQSSTMLEQAAVMKKQADAMARQADIMGLNLRKDRLFKEIDNLIKPLYEEFQPKKNVTAAHYPIETYRIRANFMANKYLGSKDLREAIDQFYDIVDNDSNIPNAREALFLAIKKRYEEVQEELDAIDKELNRG